MKILIFSPTSTILNIKGSWFDKDQPLGGADKTLIRLIDSAAEEGSVKAFIPIKEKIVTIRNDNVVELRPFEDIISAVERPDVMIQYRKLWAIPPNIMPKYRIFYSQDMPDTPCFANAKKANWHGKYDLIICLSRFHTDQMSDYFGIDRGKIRIIGNAADFNEFAHMNKNPYKFIYCSTPYRGLVPLAIIWKEIIKKHPLAELHVFSSMKIYGAEIHDKLYFEELYKRLETMEGIKYHGIISEDGLKYHLATSKLLLYPNTYPETYCNVLQEAKAALTPFITTDQGALKETGKDSGIYISGNPYSPEYRIRFIEAFETLIKINSPEYNQLRLNSMRFRSWEDYKKDIKILLAHCRGELLKKSMESAKI